MGLSNNGTDNNLIATGTQGSERHVYGGHLWQHDLAEVANSSAELGVQSSSIRYEADVYDMAEGSDALMQLRPVEFRYKQSEAGATKPPQFGLVDEESPKSIRNSSYAPYATKAARLCGAIPISCR